VKPPPLGSYVVDVTGGRVGRVAAKVGRLLRLVPAGGGREWNCDQENVRPATAAERLSAATAYVNARSRGELP
jgi:fatty acid-binding protein DegV